MQKEHWALLGVVFLGAIWGLSFPLIKLALEGFTPITMIALRLGVAAILMNAILYSRGMRLPTTRRAWRDLLVVGVIGMAIPWTLIAWGEQYISSGLTAILIGMTPIFTTLLTLVWSREEQLGWARSMGVVMGFVGVATAVNIFNLDLVVGNSLALLAVLGSAMCYAVAAIFSRQAFRGVPPMVSASGTLIVGSGVLLPLVLLVDGGLPRALPPLTAVLGLLGLTLFGTVIAYLIFYTALDILGAPRTIMTTYLVPIFALVFAWLLLGEPIGVHTVVGLGLVLGGIFVANSAAGGKPTAAVLTPPVTAGTSTEAPAKSQ